MRENYWAFVLIVICEICMSVVMVFSKNTIVTNIIIGIMSGAFVSGFIAVINYFIRRKESKKAILSNVDEYERMLGYYVSNVFSLVETKNIMAYYELVIGFNQLSDKTRDIVKEWKRYTDDLYPVSKENRKLIDEFNEMLSWYSGIFNDNMLYEKYFPQTFEVEKVYKYINSVLQKVLDVVSYEEYVEICKSQYSNFAVFMEDIYYKEEKKKIHVFTNLIRLRELRERVRKI